MIFDFLVHVLFIFPGACIRWLFTFGKVPFKEILGKDGYTNGSIGLLVFGTVMCFVKRYYV